MNFPTHSIMRDIKQSQTFLKAEMFSKTGLGSVGTAFDGSPSISNFRTTLNSTLLNPKAF